VEIDFHADKIRFTAEGAELITEERREIQNSIFWVKGKWQKYKFVLPQREQS